MLAYLFWHRPRPGADPGAYEEAQRRFHRQLEGESACFRVSALPFGGGGGYEDWYLVGDWAELGELNERAVDERRRPSHDGAALMAREGWGGIYSLVRGEPSIPLGAEWIEKPRGEPAGGVRRGSRRGVGLAPGARARPRAGVLPGRDPADRPRADLARLPAVASEVFPR